MRALLARCALRDGDALARLYELASPVLFALVLRLGGDRASAEDVLQEGFIKIWSKAGDYRADRGAPMSWMTRIMRNQAIDGLRRRPDWQSDEAQAERESGDDPLADLLNVDLDRLLQECMEALERPQREAIAMAYYAGYTHQELSLKLGNPLGTVKSWVRRGLARLKRCMDS